MTWVLAVLSQCTHGTSTVGVRAAGPEIGSGIHACPTVPMSHVNR